MAEAAALLKRHGRSHATSKVLQDLLQALVDDNYPNFLQKFMMKPLKELLHAVVALKSTVAEVEQKIAVIEAETSAASQLSMLRVIRKKLEKVESLEVHLETLDKVIDHDAETIRTFFKNLARAEHVLETIYKNGTVEFRVKLYRAYKPGSIPRQLDDPVVKSIPKEPCYDISDRAAKLKAAIEEEYEARRSFIKGVKAVEKELKDKSQFMNISKSRLAKKFRDAADATERAAGKLGGAINETKAVFRRLREMLILIVNGRSPRQLKLKHIKVVRLYVDERDPDMIPGIQSLEPAVQTAVYGFLNTNGYSEKLQNPQWRALAWGILWNGIQAETHLPMPEYTFKLCATEIGKLERGIKKHNKKMEVGALREIFEGYYLNALRQSRKILRKCASRDAEFKVRYAENVAEATGLNLVTLPLEAWPKIFIVAYTRFLKDNFTLLAVYYDGNITPEPQYVNTNYLYYTFIIMSQSEKAFWMNKLKLGLDDDEQMYQDQAMQELVS